MSFRAAVCRISQNIPKQVFRPPTISRTFVGTYTGFHRAHRYASTLNSPTIATVDPAHAEAATLLSSGTKLLEDGDVEGSLSQYKRSVELHRTPSGLFNLGVAHYHLKQFDKAIECWTGAIELDPNSADAHTNLASAYIMSPPSRPQLALQHLQTAASLAPEDGEIAFNLAAVLEACGQLEAALVQYKRSLEFNIDRAEQNIRNVSAKIFGQRLKAAGASIDTIEEKNKSS